ncbi:MAG: tRNA (N6-isopentenyl adenosine(37)-C2)-methylthiotransferase MiaB [Spirochaetales bacterium]|nr:tRNA (N6-isopentenyl adenosine(37)-C2)-methylthiotransferase MiaB [Spirochaetales bacterium]
MNVNTYWIETYGCQMNKAESGSMEDQLDTRGWVRAERDTDADVVILNTCSVRKTAETRIWGRIGHFKHIKETRPQTLIVTGCMAERLKDKFFKKTPEVDIVIGNFNKHTLGDICDSLSANGSKHLHADHDSYRFLKTHGMTGAKAFVPVMHGCNNYCSYCIVPYVRGPEVSRDPDEILGEIRRLDGEGVKEITLLGQNVNSYRYSDNGSFIDFPALLEWVLSAVKHIEWIRFLTSHPKDISKGLIRLIAEQPSLCRHIHLPVQHGSDRILSLMNRGYTASDYRELVREIKKNVSGITLSTDILIGFPGETEDDFRATIGFMKEIEFEDAFMYRYNRREGTAAATMDDNVDESIKLKRLDEIIRLQRDISLKKKKLKCGTTAKVLVETVSKKNRGELLGRTEQDEMVVFAGSPHRIGTFLNVELLSLKGNTFWGKENI